MSKYLLSSIATAGLLLTAAAVQAAVNPSLMMSYARDNVKYLKNINKAHASDWKAGTVTQYYWNSDTNAWGDASVIKYTFDNQDRLIKEQHGTHEYTEYTYDSEGRVATNTYYSLNESTGKFEKTGETTYKYDSIIKDYVIEQTTVNSESTFTFGTEITRNADNNITLLRDYTANNGASRDYNGSQIEITYGTDGKAIAIDEYYLENGKKNYSYQMKDIVWENTDGQIIQIEFDDPNSTSYFGNNRLKSANITDSNWPYPANLTVVYDGANYNSSLIMTNNTKLLTIDYKSTDSYGSYTAKSYEAEYENDGAGGYYVDFTRDRDETYTLDRFGLELEDVTTTVNHEAAGDVTETEGLRGTVTYDSTYGYPLEYIAQEKRSDSESFTNAYRTVYSDYASGIGEIEAGTEESAPVEYYNLQGVRVNNPQPGLYIRRQGENVTKTIIR